MVPRTDRSVVGCGLIILIQIFLVWPQVIQVHGSTAETSLSCSVPLQVWHRLHCVSPYQSQCSVLFSFPSSGHQLSCRVAPVSAQLPVEHLKKCLTKCHDWVDATQSNITASSYKACCLSTLCHAPFKLYQTIRPFTLLALAGLQYGAFSPRGCQSCGGWRQSCGRSWWRNTAQLTQVTCPTPVCAPECPRWPNIGYARRTYL